LRIAAPSRQRALDLIESWRPTLVHVTTEFGVGLAGLFAAREARVPVVSSYHTHFKAYLEFYGLTALDRMAWPYFRWFHNRGLRTFAPSAIVARELDANQIENVRVWSRGVDAVRFSPAMRTAAMRERLGAPDDRPLVLYVGRLAREKGIHVLMRAMRIVRERSGDAVAFALVGDGPAEAECRASAPEGTVFTGKLTGRDLSEAYAAGDVFAFPSITETFGNVVLEAMASGLAVIAPDVGATTEYATTTTARQFRAQDAEALAAAILDVAGDREARARLQAAGIATARARTWDAVWDCLVRDYRDAVADSHTARDTAAMRR
jgi:glycosyltransferase involved in cell wall biosynthesis